MDREPDLLPMSEDTFFAWAEHRDGRYELVEGALVMHAGATRDHERVAKRIFALLYATVDEARFDVNKGDFGVRIRPGQGKGSLLYPDVVVDRQSKAGGERATRTAIVVVEVLSASTDYDHHVEKLARYAKRDTLRHYVVFDQKAPRAFVWTRTEAGWPEEPMRVEGGTRASRSRPSKRASRWPRSTDSRPHGRPSISHASARQFHSHKIYYGTKEPDS